VLEVGSIVAGKLRIDRILGEGGMGIVAAATHLQLDQNVAIKILKGELANDPDTAQRFLREARASARLKNEHVCKVSDVGTLDSGEPYIVMELMEGEDLAQVIERGALPVPTVVDYVLQACIAIAEAHAVGIVHRDLKPANLFVTHRVDGSTLIKVLDFGIAKAPTTTDVRLTKTSMMMGSPAYMSPEQLRSAHDVDARTDIWSIGAILYEAATGRLPFEGTSVTELAVKVAVDPPAPLTGIDPAYAAIVMRCLEKQPEARFQNIGELASALAPLGGEPGHTAALMISRMSGQRTAQPTPTPTAVRSAAALAETTAPVPKRKVWPLALGGLLLAGVAAAGAFIVASSSRHQAPAHRDAGTQVAVIADAHVHAADAPRAPVVDADNHEVLDKLQELADSKDYSAILEIGSLAGSDADAQAIVADARQKYLASQTAALDGQIRIGACKKAKDIADATTKLVPDDTTLAAKAAACKPHAAEPAETPATDLKKANDALTKKDYAAALALAQKVLDKETANEGALKVAELATCSLHDTRNARVYYLQLNQADRNYSLYYCQKEGIQPEAEPPSASGPPPEVKDEIAQAGAALAKGDLKTANELADKALKVAPRNPQALTISGIVACRNHDAQKANAILAKLGPRKRKPMITACDKAGVPLMP
jgi:serine/threonine-protein kinase